MLLRLSSQLGSTAVGIKTKVCACCGKTYHISIAGIADIARMEQHHVRNTISHLEESGATAMASLAQIKPQKQVYDFPSLPLTAMFKGVAKMVESHPKCYEGNPDCEDDLKIYAGLAL